MRRERAVVDERQQQILQLLGDTPELALDEMAGVLHISMATLRRDLQQLQEKKLIERFHGGARLTMPQSPEGGVSRERSKIARAAAAMVEDGDTIFINTSSNALEMLRYITCENVTVITNNGQAISMDTAPGVSVILTGGELRLPKYAMVGDFAINNLQNIYAKKAFLGCSGLSAKTGVTTENASEVNINQMMCSHAMNGTYILADHSKIGKNSSFISIDAMQVAHLITDSGASEDELMRIRAKGTQVHIV